MSESSWPQPTGSPSTTEQVTDVQYEDLMTAFAGSGLKGSPADPAPVYGDATGKHVKVRANLRGLLRGRGWGSDTADETFALADNTAGKPRIDRLVLGVNRASSYQVSAYVKQGTAADTPAAPALVQSLASNGTFEIPLARIAVAAGFATINPADVSTEAWYLSAQSVVCTSTSRPNQYPGLRIYEYDTTRSYVSSGTAWLQSGGPTPSVELQRVAAMPMGPGTQAPVLWDTVVSNGDGMWNSSSANYVYVTPGKWRFTAAMFAGGNAGPGERFVWWQVGGAPARIAEVNTVVYSTVGGAGLLTVLEQRFTVSTFVETWVASNLNSSNVNFASQGITLSGEFIRP